MSGQTPPPEPAGSVPPPLGEAFESGAGEVPQEAPHVPAPAPAGATASPRVADLGRRAGAGAIDLILWFVVANGLAEVLSPGVFEAETTTPEQDEAIAIALFVTLGIWLVATTICKWRWGQTLGMRICGTRLTSEAGGRIGFLASLLHTLLAIPDAVAAWFLIPLSKTRQTLGDRAAQAVVIRGQVASQPVAVAADGVALAATTPQAELAGPGGPAAPSPATNAPWGPLWALLGLIILLGGISVIGIPFLIADPDLESPASTLGIQALLAAAMVGAAVMAASFGSGGRLVSAQALGLGRSRVNPLGWAALGYAIYIGIAIVLAALISPEQEDIAADLGYGDGWLADVLTGFLIVIAAPFAEEIFFRGFMFAGFRSRTPFLVAATISAGVWGLFHYTGSDSWPVIAQLFCFGVILAWVYERTGSIRAPIAMHLINNALAFTILITT